MDEAQKVSPGCDGASHGREALNQSFDLLLTCFHILSFSLLTTLLCGKNISNYVR